MAFRKTVRVNYVPGLSAFHFGEVDSRPVSSNPSAVYHKDGFASCKKLSDSVLPLVPLESVLKSGQMIKGDTSFAPSDRSTLEAVTSNVVDSYAKSFESSISLDTESNSVDSVQTANC